MDIQEYFDLLSDDCIQAGEELLGLNVVHKDLGEGSVVKVEVRKKQKSLIDIKFSNQKKFTFNELNENYFQILDSSKVTSDAILEFLQKNEILVIEHKEQQIKKAKLIALEKNLNQRFDLLSEKLQHFNVLNYYKDLIYKASGNFDFLVSTDSALSIVETIFQKIDLSLELTEEEINDLTKRKLFNLIATAFYKTYKKNNDLWDLVQTCKYLRKAHKPEKVIELTEDFSNSGSGHTRSKLFAAVFTTRGAAFKDTSQLDSAKKMANIAMSCDENKYTHNLLGSLCYRELNFAKGDAHFNRAIEMGSSSTERIFEIRILRQKMDLESRAKLDEHLNSISLKI